MRKRPAGQRGGGRRNEFVSIHDHLKGQECKKKRRKTPSSHYCFLQGKEFLPVNYCHCGWGGGKIIPEEKKKAGGAINSNIRLREGKGKKRFFGLFDAVEKKKKRKKREIWQPAEKKKKRGGGHASRGKGEKREKGSDIRILWRRTRRGKKKKFGAKGGGKGKSLTGRNALLVIRGKARK